MTADVGIVLFTRDLRVHDHPALAAAVGAGQVVPMFVLDPAVDSNGFATPNRSAYLAEALADLRHSLRERGGDLVVRRGDPADEVVAMARRVGAQRVYVGADVSAFAAARLRRLRAALAADEGAVETFPGVTVVPPGALTTSSGGRYQVFTPYSRAWASATWRDVITAPRRIELPDGVDPGELPAADRGDCSPGLTAGGEQAARAALTHWLRSGVARYAEQRDALAERGTSQLSAHLHFGCVSALEVARRAAAHEGGDEFVRQICWRDFHHDVTEHHPTITHRDLRHRDRRWRHDDDVIAAWKAGLTGVPIVDAGMRQLLEEGWMHNRARMFTASFLTKTLGQDWRVGAEHFLRWLVDGDIANNSANWQWVAGTGYDTRPNRVLNPIRQAERFDPHGEYTTRYVPELSGLPPKLIRQPWLLPPHQRDTLQYPARIDD